MGKVDEGFAKGKPIFVGIDVHKRDWTVHVFCQGEELYHATIAPVSLHASLTHLPFLFELHTFIRFPI